MRKLAQETRDQRKTEAEQIKAKRRRHVLGLISDYCARLSRRVKGDIERDARGQTPLGQPEGRLVYSLNEVLEQLSGPDADEVEREYRTLSVSEIEAAPGYRHLQTYCEKLAVDICLKKGSSVSWEIRLSGWD